MHFHAQKPNYSEIKKNRANVLKKYRATGLKVPGTRSLVPTVEMDQNSMTILLAPTTPRRLFLLPIVNYGANEFQYFFHIATFLQIKLLSICLI